MKKLFTLIALLAINFTLFSQAPQKLSYQAVIRNSTGGLVTSHAVGMKISILQGSPTGTAVYIETHTITTNVNGLATIEIGGGSVVSGTFAGINWGSGTYYLKTETDPAGATSYTIVGTSQLLSVPYALYAKTGGGLSLPFAATANNGTANFSITNSNSGMSSIAIEGNADAASGYGTALFGRSSGLNGSGIVGRALSTTGENFGARGESYSNAGYGVKGYASSTSGTNYGVYGETKSSNGYGIKGFANNISGINYGVYGESLSASGYGVFGKSPNYGVYGESSSASGYGIYGKSAKYGVAGVSTSNQGRAVTGDATGTSSIGVQGVATNTSSTGVWGEGSNQGVYGISALSIGKGVYGKATHATGAVYGVYGETGSTGGYGVYGTAPVYGVYGRSSSDNGRGVQGEAFATTGYANGIYGSTYADRGCGVYGIALNETGETYGGHFTALSSTGTGVKAVGIRIGIDVSTTGRAGSGVYSSSTGESSVAVFGKATGLSSVGVRGEGTWGDFYASGPGINYASSSSIRWKRDIQPIPQPLDKIRALRGVCFNWDEDHGGHHDLGMIAEEVGVVLPEIVLYEENGMDAIGLDYSKITPLLLEAIKEQQKEIDVMKAENNQLKSRLETIERSLKVKQNNRRNNW